MSGSGLGPASAPSSEKSSCASPSEDLTECPVCYNPVYPPIRICKNGHALCQSCSYKLPKIGRTCPTCRTPLSPHFESMERSEDLERLFLSAPMVRCCHSQYGCTEAGPGAEMSKHQDVCPFSSCGVTVTIDNLEDILASFRSRKSRRIFQFNSVPTGASLSRLRETPQSAAMDFYPYEYYTSNLRATTDDI